MSEHDLEKILKKVEKRVSYLSVEDRIEVIAGVKQLLERLSREKSLSVKQVFRQFNSIEEMINIVLQDLSMPLLKNSFWQRPLFWILTFITIILSLVLYLVLTIKSFFPLININDTEATLELFGKHIVLEKDDRDFFDQLTDKKFMHWKSNAVLTKGVFDFPPGENLSLVIKFPQGKLALRPGPDSELKYECYASKNLGSLFSKVQDKLIMQFAQEHVACMLYLPVKKTLTINMQEGVLNIKNLQQSMDVTLTSGVIVWKVDRKRDFYLQKLEATVVRGDTHSYSNHGIWSVKLVVKDGVVILR